MGETEQPETGGKDDEFSDRTRDRQLCAAHGKDNRNRVHAEIKAIEARQADLALVMKHTATYRKLKPIYEQYRRSGDKEKFMRGHESEIILFEAAARELKRLDAVPLPSTEKINVELTALASKNVCLMRWEPAIV